MNRFFTDARPYFYSNVVARIFRFLRRQVLRTPLVEVKAPGGYGQRYLLRGRFKTWQEALSKSKGYEDPFLVNQSVERNRLRNQEIANGDFVLTEKEIQTGFALSIARSRLEKSECNVLDWGGELGGLYQIPEVLFPRDWKTVHWTVLETPAMTRAGKEFFQHSHLQFTDDFHLLRKTQTPFDVILASGVLQCLEDPRATFKEWVTHAPRYLIISGIPFLKGHQDVLTVRHVEYESSEESYPLWLFSRADWKVLFERDYSIVMQWDMKKSDSLNGMPVRYGGFLLERR